VSGSGSVFSPCFTVDAKSCLFSEIGIGGYAHCARVSWGMRIGIGIGDLFVPVDFVFSQWSVGPGSRQMRAQWE
jgi:hypothetical protein